MTVVSAHLEASHFIPSVTTPQIVLLMPVHLWTPTQKHKFPWYPNSISVQLPFIPPMSFFKRCHMHSRAKRCVSLQSHSACPRLLMEGGTSKGGRENERGHFSLGTGVKLTGGLQALWTSHGSLICWIAGRQSRTDWRVAGRVKNREKSSEWYWETEEETCLKKRKKARKDKAEGESNLAMPHLCKSHLIFPLT